MNILLPFLRNGYGYAAKNFQPLETPLHPTDRKWAQSSSNDLLAMGAALAGCKFYVANPMSPTSHILKWFAKPRKEARHLCPAGRGRDLGRQHVHRKCAPPPGFAICRQSHQFAGIHEVAKHLMRDSRIKTSQRAENDSV